MDNEHNCILSRAIWMHRDTVMKPWGPLSCHSSTAMFQHESAWPHVTRICKQFLEAENVPVFPWSAYSPDMSPIDYVWDALDRVRQRVPVPANIQQLCTDIGEDWDNIPQATINSLINSMRRRCVALREVATPDTDWSTPISKKIKINVGDPLNIWKKVNNERCVSVFSDMWNPKIRA